MKEEEFRKYMHPGYTSLYVAAGVAVAAGAMAYVVREKGSPLLVILIGLAVCIFLVWSWISQCRSYNAFIELHRERGDLDQILDDFSRAESWFKDKVRTGEEVMYLRCSDEHNLLKYSAVKNFYEYVHHTNGAEDRRSLCAVLTGGVKLDVCSLETRGRSSEEVARFCAYVLQKNPDISFGYDKARELMR